ncbi:MAG: hypothetical protein ABL997_06555 [Planctomycetota bacterium]
MSNEDHRLDPAAPESASSEAASNHNSQQTHTTEGGLQDLIREAATANSKIQDLLSRSATSAQTLAESATEATRIDGELTALAQSLQAKSQQASETIVKAEATLEAVRQLVDSASNDSARVSGLVTQVEQSAQVAAQRSSHIEEGRKYVDGVRAELDTLKNEAQKSAALVTSHLHESKSSTEALASLVATSNLQKQGIDSATKEAQDLLEQCRHHQKLTHQLAAVSSQVEQRVAKYEDALKELQAKASERLQTIEGLLPGAASAGLASAFDMRRRQFRLPMLVWHTLFVLSLAGLITIAWLEFGILTNPASTETWDRLALMLVHRLPFMAPLAWLAYYSSTKAALAQRVEEDYAFKEAVSRSFEGYRREMSELSSKATPQSALDKFCGGVLGVVTSPPGRIYEKHPLVHTPFQATDLMINQVGSQPK